MTPAKKEWPDQVILIVTHVTDAHCNELCRFAVSINVPQPPSILVSAASILPPVVILIKKVVFGYRPKSFKLPDTLIEFFVSQWSI